MRLGAVLEEEYGDKQAVKNFVAGKHPRKVERAKNARVELSALYQAMFRFVDGRVEDVEF